MSFQPDPEREGLKLFFQTLLGQMSGFNPDLNQGAAEQAYQQDAARSRQQYGVMQNGSPNALQGGVVSPSPFVPASAEDSIPMPPNPPGAFYDYRGASAGANGAGWYLQDETEQWPHQGGPPNGGVQDLMFRYPETQGARDFYGGQGAPMQEQALQGQSPMQDLVRQFQQNPPDEQQRAALSSFGQKLQPEQAPVSSGAPGADLALANSSAPKKKKGEFSEFFQLLRAAKSEDKKGPTRKAMKALLKDMEAQTTISPT